MFRVVGDSVLGPQIVKRTVSDNVAVEVVMKPISDLMKPGLLPSSSFAYAKKCLSVSLRTFAPVLQAVFYCVNIEVYS